MRIGAGGHRLDTHPVHRLVRDVLQGFHAFPQHHDQHPFKSHAANPSERLARPAVEAFERIAQNECPAGFQRLFFLSIADQKSYNHRKFHGFMLNLMAVTPERGNQKWWPRSMC